jgi:murein DD-endopeptidase MepM/ murein hydrolase activator NlpD
MMKVMKKQKMTAVIMAIVTFIALCTTPMRASASVAWPGISQSKSIKVYTISTGNTTSYSDANLTKKVGTIYASDEIYVTSISKNSKGRWIANCTYPVKNGRKSAIIPLSAITSATAPSEKGTASASITTYRRASNAAKAGSVSKNDVVYKLASSGSYTQILYNIGSASSPTGYRMAWITTSSYNSYVKKAGSTTTATTYYVTTKAGLCLRSSASTSSSLLTTIPYGAAVQVYSISGNWARCSYNGKSGYCSTSYISKNKPATGGTTALSYGLYHNNSAYISCTFDGYKNTSGRHEGIDIKCYVGASVYSLTDGVVVRVANGYNGSNGLSTIAIYNPSTDKTVIYLHSAPVSTLKAGQTISKGQKIGTEAWRGVSSSSAAHTHVEVRNGRQGYASKSVGDPVLNNSNPTSFWNGRGYTIK